MSYEQATEELAPEAAPTAQSRRKVLGWLLTGINLAVGAALAVPAVKFVVSPLGRRSKETWVDVLAESDLQVGQTREVTYSLTVQDGYHIVDRKYTVYLHRDANGVKCFDPACTHLGCRIKYQDDQKRYFCPCHGGVFYEDGSHAAGPPPRGLYEYKYKVEDGHLWIKGGHLPTLAEPA